MSEKNKIPKVFLIDIDGTICDDIPNETPELFETAKPFEDALPVIKHWKEQGHQIHFFTARKEEHRDVTEAWLKKHGFEYDSLVMNKPRIKEGQEYLWVDNRKVRSITYKGNFTKLVEKETTILTFEDQEDGEKE